MGMQMRGLTAECTEQLVQGTRMLAFPFLQGSCTNVSASSPPWAYSQQEWWWVSLSRLWISHRFAAVSRALCSPSWSFLKLHLLELVSSRNAQCLLKKKNQPTTNKNKQTTKTKQANMFLPPPRGSAKQALQI